MKRKVIKRYYCAKQWVTQADLFVKLADPSDKTVISATDKRNVFKSSYPKVAWSIRPGPNIHSSCQTLFVHFIFLPDG